MIISASKPIYKFSEMNQVSKWECFINFFFSDSTSYDHGLDGCTPLLKHFYKAGESVLQYKELHAQNDTVSDIKSLLL